MSAEFDFDPYRKWLGIPLEQQPPSHYRLLGLADFEKDHDVIENAYERCAAHVKTFATGDYADLAKRVLKELKSAERCLLDAKTKKVYDADLRKRVPPAAPPEAARPVSAAPATPIPKVQPVPVSSTTKEPQDHPLAELGSVSSGSKAHVYKLRRKRSNSTPWLVMLGLAVFLLGAALIFALSRSNKTASRQSVPASVRPAPKPVTIKAPPKQKRQDYSPIARQEDHVPIKIEPKEIDKFEQPPQKEEPKAKPQPEVKAEDLEQQPEAAKRLAIPEGEPLQAARRWLRENYRAQTKTPAEKRSSLESLIEAAGDPEQVPAQRYVLLQRASELAIELIDLQTLTLINRELASKFEENLYKLQGDALIQAERKATSPEQGQELYSAAGELLEESQKLRRYDVAIVATEVAGRSARRAGDLEAQRSAEELQKDLKAKLAAQQAGTEPGPLEKLPPGEELKPSRLKSAGLIHHWKFDESEGNEALCSITNQSSPIRGTPRWVKGRVGGGLELSFGTFVEAVEGPNLDQQDPYTLAAWVKTSRTEPMAILARTDDDKGFRGYDLSLINLIPHTVLVHSHPSSSLVVAGTEKFSADEWHHVAATHDGSGKAEGIKLFLDGVEQTLNVLTDTLDDSTVTDVPLHIGKRNKILSYAGSLDEVRIYNRALSAAEIAALVKEAGNP